LRCIRSSLLSEFECLFISDTTAGNIPSLGSGVNFFPIPLSLFDTFFYKNQVPIPSPRYGRNSWAAL
jgi:hypothetical protein